MPSYRNTSGASKPVIRQPAYNPSSKKFSGTPITVTIPAGTLFTFASQYPAVTAMYQAQMTGWTPVPGG